MAFSFKFPDSVRLSSTSSAVLSARLAPLLPLLLGLLALFWLGGQLVFRLSPAPQKILPLAAPAPTGDAGRVASQHWFGEPLAAGGQTAAPALKVIGVYASGNALSDFAIIDEGQGAQALRVGHKSAGGWTLLAVGPRSIRVSSAGAEQEIALARPEVMPGMVQSATDAANVPPPAASLPDGSVVGSGSVPVESEPPHVLQPSDVPSSAIPADASTRADAIRRPQPSNQP